MAYREDDGVPMTSNDPVEEQGTWLQKRAHEAAARIDEAERVIREWTPVRESCAAGLEALPERTGGAR